MSRRPSQPGISPAWVRLAAALAAVACWVALFSALLH